MGTEFWWFYDIIAAAIILVCIFLSAKKGVMKGTFAMTACILAALLAFGISGSFSGALYEMTIKSGNTKKISKNIEENTFLNKYSSYLEGLGYNIRVNTDKMDSIFSSGGDYTSKICKYVNNINSKPAESDEAVLREKIIEGYAVVVSDLVYQSLNSKYVAESAAKLIRENSDSINELIPLITNHDVQHSGVVYIVDHYTAEAYKTMFRLALFVALFAVFAVIIGIFIKSFAGSRNDDFPSAGSHAVGGFVGIVSACFIIFAAAAAVRLWAIMGSNEMLFFNNEAVDKSYIFKYFYHLTMKI